MLDKVSSLRGIETNSNFCNCVHSLKALDKVSSLRGIETKAFHDSTVKMVEMLDKVSSLRGIETYVLKCGYGDALYNC